MHLRRCEQFLFCCSTGSECVNAISDVYQVMFYQVQKIGVAGDAMYHFAAHTHVSSKQALGRPHYVPVGYELQ